MDEPEGVMVVSLHLVGRMQPVEGPRQDRRDDADRGRLGLGIGPAEQAGEGLALFVLHDEPQGAFVLDDVDHAEDVHVADARGEAGLVDEHGERSAVLEVAVEALHREQPPEALDVPTPREEDPPEAARCYGREQLVGTDHVHAR